MSGPIDVPDYQRGFVSAQVKLGTFPAGTAVGTVGVPPNAETIVILAPDIGQVTTCQVIGAQSGVEYAGSQVFLQGAPHGSAQYFFDVSGSLDTNLFIEYTSTPAVGWTVYADSASHIGADVSKRTDNNGHQYIIPVIPNPTTGQRPRFEATVAAGFVNGGGTLLGNPGVGSHFRLFGLTVGTLGTFVEVQSTTGIPTTQQLLALCGPGNGSLGVPVQGLALQDNANINVGGQGGQQISYSICYSIEQA